MKNLISNSIWFIAALALVRALVATSIDAGAQTPEPEPTEVSTCWFDEAAGTWICIGAAPTEPTPTATPVVPPPVAVVYLPLVAGDVVVTGDVQ